MTDETRDSEARCPGQELTATCSQDTPPVSGTPLLWLPAGSTEPNMPSRT